MEKTVYELMHGEKIVADIGTNGVCTVLDRAFLPFSIYLEDTAENDDLDIRMDNFTNFYYWCATRVLTLDRVYAKEILNSIGALQAQTDRDRAKIALSYHCLSLIFSGSGKKGRISHLRRSIFLKIIWIMHL